MMLFYLLLKILPRLNILFLILLLAEGITFSPIQAAEWSTIQKRDFLKIGVKDNTRPLGFRDSQGRLQGLEIDLAKQLALELLGSEAKVQLEPVKNQDRLNVLLADQVDLVIARLTITPGRSRLVDFSDYYYLDGTGLITLQPNLKHLADFQNQAIGVINPSDTIAVIRSQLPQARLVGVNSYEEGLDLLQQGKIQAFAADNSLLTGWAQEDSRYYHLPFFLSGTTLAIAMPRGLAYQELRQKVNEAVRRWRTNGWLRERVRYWGLP